MRRAAASRAPKRSSCGDVSRPSLAEQAPTVPLVNYNNLTLTAERVGNYQHHPTGGPLLDQIWVR